MQKQYSSLSRYLTFSVLVLAFLFSAMILPSQNTETMTQEPNNWVRIEETRWTELQNLSMVLETRLMTRVEQVKNLQTLLARSQQTIENLEYLSQRLNNQLREISKSRDELENLLTTERQASAEYITSLIDSRNIARTERDIELKRGLEAENKRNTYRTVSGISIGLNIVLLLLALTL